MTEFRSQKLLFGLSLGTAKKIKSQVEAEVLRKHPEMQTVCRYRKEGIYQYLKEQENVLVIMEENLQGGSGYNIGELQQLTDLGNSRIIFLLDHTHMGDDYVKALYCCGILDALYMDEITSKEVLNLVFHARGHEAARKYYGIQILRDAEKADGIVDEGKLGAYLEFIEDETDRGDRGDRYRFVSTRLSAEENRILADSISAKVAHDLKGNEVFGFYRGRSREDRRFFKRRKKDGGAEGMPERQEALTEEPRLYLPRATACSIPENDEDEMIRAMERFWTAGGTDDTNPDEGNGSSLIAMFAGYLDTIDT